MARILIVGGEQPVGESQLPRALLLARELAEAGHAVRWLGELEPEPAELARARDPEIEICAGDMRRLGSAHRALERVSVAIWLLGRANGSAREIAELHAQRLEAFIGRVVDSSARAFIYEAAGSVGAETLAAGLELSAGMCERNALGFAALRSDPGEVQAWLAEARGACSKLLGS